MSEVEAELTILRARAVAKLKSAGVAEETLRMIASRMAGPGQPSFEGRRPGARVPEAVPDSGWIERRPPARDDRKSGRPKFDF